MAYSTLATQADTPTAGPAHAYFDQIAANFTALRRKLGAVVRRSTNQTISAHPTVVSFDTADFDNGGFTNIGGAPTKITVPSAQGGIYLVGGTIWINDASAAGTFQVFSEIRVNGSAIIAINKRLTSGAATAINASDRHVKLFTFAATDYIEMVADYTLTTTATTDVTKLNTWMWMFKLSA